MTFIADSHFLNEEMKNKVREMEKSKMLNANINKSVKEKMPKKIPQNKMIEEINKLSNKNKKSNSEVKQHSLKDIEKELKIRKLANELKEEEHEKKEEEIEELLDNSEILEIKDGFIDLLSYSHLDPTKRKIFANRLSKSSIVDNYVNDNVVFKLFQKANSNIKFACVYGLHYFKTNDDYERLLLLQQMRNQQQQHKKEEEIQEKEEEKEEEKENEEEKTQ